MESITIASAKNLITESFKQTELYKIMLEQKSPLFKEFPHLVKEVDKLVTPITIMLKVTLQTGTVETLIEGLEGVYPPE